MERYTKYIEASVNPTLGTDAYTAGDVVGGLLTFTLPGLTLNGGKLNRLIFVDEDAVAANLVLYLFNATPTTIADDAAFATAVLIADMNKLVDVIAIADASKTELNSIDYYILDDIGNLFTTTTGALYGYLVDNSGGTWTNVDAITIRLYVESGP